MPKKIKPIRIQESLCILDCTTANLPIMCRISHWLCWPNVVSPWHDIKINSYEMLSMVCYRLFFSQLVSGRNSTNPAIWLVLEVGRNFLSAHHSRQNPSYWSISVNGLAGKRPKDWQLLSIFCPFYTSIDNWSMQVYLYSPLNSKESHCK